MINNHTDAVTKNILLGSEKFRLAELYWENQLQTDFATDSLIYYPQIKDPSGRPSRISANVPDGVTERIHAVAKEADLSIYTFFVASVRVLAMVYGCKPALDILSPVLESKRNDDCLGEYAIFQFVNRGDLTVKKLLLDTANVVSQGYTHQHYPLADMISKKQALAPDVLNWHLPNLVCRMEELHGSWPPGSSHTVVFSLARNNGLKFTINFDPTVCPDWWITQIQAHLLRVLDWMGSNLNVPLCELQILTAEEETGLIYTYNATHRSYPEHEGLTDLFRQSVRTSPESIAVVFNDIVLSYRELDNLSDRLAGYLFTVHELRHGDHLVILMERSHWWLVGILAAWKIGAIYVPLDVAYPAERIDWICSETQCATVLDQRAIEMFLNDSQKHSFEVVKNAPDDIAYMIYTSGTTGTPKGVMIEHAGMLNHLYAKIYDLNMNEESHVLQNASHCFDISIWQLFCPLLAGGTVHIYANEVALDATAFIAGLNRDEITIAEVVPSYLLVLTEYMERHGNRLPKLKYLLVTGEMLKPSLLKRFFSICASVQAVNAYGPTEASDDITHKFLTTDAEYHVVPVGKPLQNTNIYVLDENDRLCPLGVKGEVCVSGVGVGRGYFKDPQKTALSFMNDLFRPNEKWRLYRTGDIGRRNLDGDIELFGREDEQVKIRGYRIELQEIERAIFGLGIANDVVVLITESDNRPASLVAFVASSTNGIRDNDLKQALAKKLPVYMIPDSVLLVNTFPLTGNGKIDRKALLGIYQERIAGGLNIAPRTELHKKMVGIWSDVLQIHIADISLNFFSIGGHSLNAIRLITMVNQELGIRLKLSDIFTYPTIAQLCERLATHAASEITVPLKRCIPRAYYPLSTSQRQIWIAHQLDQHGGSYNIFRSIELGGSVSLRALQRALNKLTELHDTLRTRFIVVEGVPYQEILANPRINKVRELFAESGSAYSPEVKDILAGLYARRFNLEKGPLVEVTAVHLWASGRVILALNVHHILMDGWSLLLFIEQLFEEYRRLLSGVDREAPPLPLQFQDFVQWQQNINESPLAQDGHAYWLSELGQIPPPPELPYRLDVLHRQKSSGGANVRIAISATQRKMLEKIAGPLDATIFMALLATIYTLLLRYSRRSELVLGTPISARTESALDSMLGLMINVIPLRVTIENGWRFADLLKQVKTRFMLGYDYQHTSGVLWKEQLQSAASNSLFNVMVVMQNYLKGQANITRDLAGNEIEIGNNSSKFDLLFEIVESDSDILIDIEYSADRFEHATIVRMASHLTTVIDAIAEGPDTPVTNIQYIPSQERECIEKFRGPAHSVKDKFDVREAFRNACLKHSEKIAVVCGHQQYSYGQLETFSNQVAEFLLRSVGTNKNVIVWRERSALQPALMLGIFRAGGCYIPLDPNWPAERCEYVLKASSPAVIFVDGVTATRECTMKDRCIDPASLQPSYLTVESVGVSDEDASYILYTSGSTGVPKGVVQTYGTVNNLMLWMTTTQLPHEAAYLQFTSFGFDVSIQDMTYSLLTGGILHIADADVRMEPAKLADYVIREKIEIISMPYSVLVRLLQELNKRGDQLALKTIITAGEQCAFGPALREFLEAHPMPVHNHYGPSETHVCTSFTWYPGDTLETVKAMPIGKPVNGFEIAIFDPSFQDTGIGLPGEIFIRGAGVFNGYLNDPLLTESKLVSVEGRKWYRSGDVGKWLADGNISFIGRSDDQLKINGYRIESGEVENLLLDINQIQQAAVLKRQIGEKEMLVCFLQTKGQFNERKAREELIGKLPYYMVPEIFVVLDTMPVNTNGKLDRQILAAWEITAPSPETGPTSPQGEEELALVEIWKELLQKETLTTQDNFFLLGGQSLKATQMMMMVAQKLRAEISLKTIFTYPTIEGLADYIRRTKATALSAAEIGNDNTIVL